jgi:hypothetical protein
VSNKVKPPHDTYMLHVFLTYSALNQAPFIRALLVSTSCHLISVISLLNSLAPEKSWAASDIEVSKWNVENKPYFYYNILTKYE